MQHYYERQTVVDNVSLLSPQLLAKVNQLLVQACHEVVGKKPGETLCGRADSFCVETNVHYPTDVNLLWDAMRCTVREAASLARALQLGGWRQHRHIIGKVLKKSFNRVRTSKRIRRSPARVEEYLGICQKYLMRAEYTLMQTQALELTGIQ